MTNRDKVLEMDLVDLMYDYEIRLEEWCQGKYCSKKYVDVDDDCKECITKWLNKDVGEEVNMKENKELSDDNNEVKEIQRHANVGEWIKIDNCQSNEYKNGDIFKIIETGACAVSVKSINADSNYIIFDREYVVLENYTPPKKKKKKSKWKTENPTKKGMYYVTVKSENGDTFTLVMSLDALLETPLSVLAWMKLPKKYKEKGLV